jgi:transglutaminase-like putative cysteine protease
MLSKTALASALFAATASAAAVAEVPARSIHATYVATVESVPAGLNRLEVWVPVPQDAPNQTVRNVRVDSPYLGQIRQEREFGNRYFYFSTDRPQVGRLEIKVSFDLTRTEVRRPGLSTASRREETLSREEIDRYLRPEALVTISPRVRQLARQVTWGQTTPEGKARAIYEYLINTMTYDKTTPGWGQGDTERACDVAKGNCTDFHSLFLSLTRAEGIPSRFIIGFPLKPDPKGTIPGYHCWAEFHIAGKGWISVDASDASKLSDPKKRDYLFGNLDPDRLEFTRGRNLRLDPPPCAESLNFFIYPYAEGDGRAITPVSIRLDYENVPAAEGKVALLSRER